MRYYVLGVIHVPRCRRQRSNHFLLCYLQQYIHSRLERSFSEPSFVKDAEFESSLHLNAFERDTTLVM